MNNTTRFSNRVDDYVRYRPSYPREVVEFLSRELSLFEGASVADVGSGTGIFSQLLLDAGYRVLAVEPNEPMRRAAERLIGSLSGFNSVAASAEHTTLPESSVSLVTAAQAFHWFDVPEVRREFGRILQPGGAVALLWNDRREDSTAFASEYQALIDTYNIDLDKVDHRRITRDEASSIEALYGADGFSERLFDNAQVLDFDGLRGRIASSSYMPPPGAPRYDDMIAELRTLFEAHAVDGSVRIDYVTRLYHGSIGDDE